MRVTVPPSLWSILDRQYLQKTTGTRDIVEARRRRWQIVSEFQRVIDEARKFDSGHTGTVGSILNHLALLKQQLRAGLITQDSAEDEWDQIIEHVLLDIKDSITKEQAAAHALVNHKQFTYLGDAIDLYLKDGAEHLRPSTVGKQKARLHAFMNWLGDVDIASITRAQAGQYVREVLRNGQRHITTVKQTIGTLSSFFNWTSSQGIAEYNPFDGVARSIRESKRGTSKSTQH